MRKKGYENPNIPRITSDKLFDIFDLNLKRGNVVIIDGLKYHFNGKDKLYIDKNAAKSADIQGKKYKEMIDLKLYIDKNAQKSADIQGKKDEEMIDSEQVLANSRFDEIFNLILQKSGTDGERNRNVNIYKIVNNEAYVRIKGNDGRNGILRVFYNPHIDYRKIEIWWNSDNNRDEFYALARERSGKFELDSNDGGRRFVHGKTVYNEILPVFSKYLQNKE